MPIAKWSDVNRFPRKGMIRLGVKGKSASGAEYPMKTDYFVCPPEVQAVYGPKPTHLDIVIPIEGDIDDVFPQWYKLYGASGLKGRSDGIHKWMRPESSDMEWIKSPTTEAELKEMGFKESATLTFILPKVTLSGSYQIVTSSFQSIVNINAIIRMIRGWIGRISGIPLHLYLEPQHTSFTEKGQLKKTTSYTLKIEFHPEEIKTYLANKAAAYSIEGPKLAIPQGQMTEEPEEAPEDTAAEFHDNEEAPIDTENPMANFESFNEAIDPGSDPGQPEQKAMAFNQGDTASSVAHAQVATIEAKPAPTSVNKIMDPSACPNKADHPLLTEICNTCTYNPTYANARKPAGFRPTYGLHAGEYKKRIEAATKLDELETINNQLNADPTTMTAFEKAMLKGLINKQSEKLTQS